MKNYKFLLLGIFIMVNLLNVSNAFAATTLILCETKSTGAIAVKTKCTSKEVKLTASNLVSISSVSGPAGIQGPIGPQGIQGVKGDAGANGLSGQKGDPGDSAFAPVPSGKSIYGAFVDRQGTDDNLRAFVSFPVPLPTPLTSNKIIVAPTDVVLTACPLLIPCIDPDTASTCAGTADAPTAPPGILCIYPTEWSGVENVGFTMIGTAEELSSRFGFEVDVVKASIPGLTFPGILSAVWAYTAP